MAADLENEDDQKAIAPLEARVEADAFKAVITKNASLLHRQNMDNGSILGNKTTQEKKEEEKERKRLMTAAIESLRLTLKDLRKQDKDFHDAMRRERRSDWHQLHERIELGQDRIKDALGLPDDKAVARVQMPDGRTKVMMYDVRDGQMINPVELTQAQIRKIPPGTLYSYERVQWSLRHHKEDAAKAKEDEDRHAEMNDAEDELHAAGDDDHDHDHHHEAAEAVDRWRAQPHSRRSYADTVNPGLQASVDTRAQFNNGANPVTTAAPAVKPEHEIKQQPLPQPGLNK